MPDEIPQTEQKLVVTTPTVNPPQPQSISHPNSGNSSSKPFWVEVLVVGIILATLGWLAIQVYAINGTVAELRTQSITSEKTTSKIITFLPEWAKFIAQTKVNAPVDLAVVSSNPFKDKKGNLVKTVNLIDTKNEQLKTYTIPSDDSAKSLVLGGTIYSLSVDPVRFSNLVDYSLQAGNPVTIASIIDVNNSFILKNISDSMRYSMLMNKYFGQPTTKKLEFQVGNWTQLSLTLKSNTEAMKVVQ